LLEGRCVGGDPDRVIRSIAPTSVAGPASVTFLTSPRYRDALSKSTAAAVILAESDLVYRPASMVAIVVSNASIGFARAAQRLSPRPPQPAEGVHSSAVVEGSARLEAGVAVGPLAYVGPRAVIGARAVLHAGAQVEQGATIGPDSIVYNRAVIRHGCRIGARCIVHPGAVIGADGFGFAGGTTGGSGGATIDPIKIPQVGGVEIEDDVEIGANATVDRGTFADTRIGRGAKIDNLVQVGHNASIGAGAILVAQSGVAGSSVLEDGVVLGAQSGISGHLVVGARAVVYGQAGVMRDVPAGAKVAGTPAEDRTSFFRSISRLRKLDSLVERVRELERAFSALTNRHDQT
ncbi:MAG: UDP-3-O-(3-hydroxymyristoyl)glucosamine N-acyltransferase, partial [Pseudomonadota bacterium]